MNQARTKLETVPGQLIKPLSSRKKRVTELGKQLLFFLEKSGLLTVIFFTGDSSVWMYRSPALKV